MALAGLDSNGDQLELDGDGNLVLQNDRLAYVEGTGFLPNSDVKLYLFSTPTYLGIVHTDADGNFSGTVEIPQEIEAGIHTLQANGFSDDGVIRSLSLGVSVTDAVGGGKKKTGKAKIFFAIDSAHITKSAKKAIRKMIKQLGSKNLKVVRILGFATPSDSLLADRKLSIKRAKAVKAFLKSIGVKGKFNVLGKGRSKTHNPTGRRVAITAWWIKPTS
jgi:outer membrane protein OmpA-like peptidoglycan-associated protein